MKTMTPKPASKKMTATATKIKNKILSESLSFEHIHKPVLCLAFYICVICQTLLLFSSLIFIWLSDQKLMLWCFSMNTSDTSSFFKVSLKTNNKALALALETQKERNRQLEKEIMYLQKQVEGLCFELATKKYKHRKLVGLLENSRVFVMHFRYNGLNPDLTLFCVADSHLGKSP